MEETVDPHGVADEDEFDKIPTLTYEEILTMMEEHEKEKKKLLWETRNIGDKVTNLELHLNFGVKSLTRKRIYTVIIERTNTRTRKFHVHYSDIVEGKPFEWIAGDSNRFVDVKYANRFYPPMLDMLGSNNLDDNPTITIENPAYNPHGSSNKTPYWPADMETEPGSPGFEARLAEGLKASLNYQQQVFPEERREGNPGPQSEPQQRKNVRFSEETAVVSNPNDPNPDYYSGMSFEEELQAAIALSNQQASAGAGDAVVPSITPHTRDLDQLEFDLVIEDVVDKGAERMPPPPSYTEAVSDPSYRDVTMETRQEWLARLKQTNLISEADHMKADIVL